MTAKTLPKIDYIKLSKTAHGINVSLLKNVMSYVQEKYKEHESAMFIYFSEIPNIADGLHASTEETFKSFMFFSNKYPKYVQMVAIYFEENFVYHLEPEDLDEVKSTNSFHHPDNPKIIITNADKRIRHAFMFRYPNEVK